MTYPSRTRRSWQEFRAWCYLQLPRKTTTRCTKMPSQHAQGSHQEDHRLDTWNNRLRSSDYVALRCCWSREICDRTYARGDLRDLWMARSIFLLLEDIWRTQQCKSIRRDDCAPSHSGDPCVTRAHCGSRRLQPIYL